MKDTEIYKYLDAALIFSGSKNQDKDPGKLLSTLFIFPENKWFTAPFGYEFVLLKQLAGLTVIAMKEVPGFTTQFYYNKEMKYNPNSI